MNECELKKTQCEMQEVLYIVSRGPCEGKLYFQTISLPGEYLNRINMTNLTQKMLSATFSLIMLVYCMTDYKDATSNNYNFPS